MSIEHKKEFGIYHWDTFDNETIFLHEENKLVDAEKWVTEHYGNRIKPNGADQCDIVNKAGDIVRKFSIG